MNRYRFWSEQGSDLGAYEASCFDNALEELNQDAGFIDTQSACEFLGLTEEEMKDSLFVEIS